MLEIAIAINDILRREDILIEISRLTFLFSVASVYSNIVYFIDQSKYKVVTSISNDFASLNASITVFDSWNAKLIS